MNISVLIKQVPDTETHIKIRDNRLVEEGIKWVISPYDENAIEEAVQQAEKHNLQTNVVSYGPKRVESALRTAMGFGLGTATHLLADADANNGREQENGYDALDINMASAVLAAYLATAPADVILCGHTAIDSQSAMVPVMLAAHLQIAFVSEIVSLEIQGNEVTVQRELDGYVQEIKTQTPVVLSVSKKINKPRYPSLKNIIAAKKKKVESISASTLKGIDSSVPRVEVLSMELPPVKPRGRVIEGETVQEKAERLVEALANEAKVL